MEQSCLSEKQRVGRARPVCDVEQKNTQRELGKNKAFVKKGSSWDTARKKENVKLNVKLYIDHKLQTCCRFILIHIHMYLPMLVPAEAISIANNSSAFL